MSRAGRGSPSTGTTTSTASAHGGARAGAAHARRRRRLVSSEPDRRRLRPRAAPPSSGSPPAGTELLVTVDCAITAVDEVAAARAAGLDVVVTDHHTPRADGALPDAPIVHPAVGGYPCPELCAAGVAHKLARRAARGGGPRPGRGRRRPRPRRARDGRGRRAARGREPPPRARGAAGARGDAQARAAGADGGRAASTRAASTPARSGSGSRRGSTPPGGWTAPTRGWSCCSPRDGERAARSPHELDRVNAERRDVEQRILLEAEAQVAEQGARRAYVLAADGWHPGVIGIVASRIAERHHRPAVLIALDGDEGTGSGRSIPAFDLLGGLDAARRPPRHGGHRAAAGLTIARGRVEAFRAAFSAHAAAALPGGPLPVERVDAVVSGDGSASASPRSSSARAVRDGQPGAALLVPAALLATRGRWGRARHVRFTVEAGGGARRARRVRRAARCPAAPASRSTPRSPRGQPLQRRGGAAARPPPRPAGAARSRSRWWASRPSSRPSPPSWTGHSSRGRRRWTDAPAADRPSPPTPITAAPPRPPGRAVRGRRHGGAPRPGAHRRRRLGNAAARASRARRQSHPPRGRGDRHRGPPWRSGRVGADPMLAVLRHACHRAAALREPRGRLLRDDMGGGWRASRASPRPTRTWWRSTRPPTHIFERLFAMLPGHGWAHLAWGGAERSFARRVHAWEYGPARARGPTSTAPSAPTGAAEGPALEGAAPRGRHARAHRTARGPPRPRARGARSRARDPGRRCASPVAADPPRTELERSDAFRAYQGG